MANGCCDETNALLGRNNELLTKIYNLIGDGFKIVPLGSEDTDVWKFGTCVPDHYDSDQDDTGDDILKRGYALCHVIKMYIIMCVLNALEAAGMPIESMLTGLSQAVPQSLFNVKTSTNAVAAMLTAAAGVIGGDALMTAISCAMHMALTNKPVTFSAFRDSLPKLLAGDASLMLVQNMVVKANQSQKNWECFVDALSEAMDMDIGEPDCCAEITPPIAADCGNVSLVDFDNTGCVIEYMGDCVWKFTQTSVNGQGRRYYSFKDVNDLVLNVEYPPEPYQQPITGGCTVGGACGNPDYYGDNFGGGFAPSPLAKVNWWVGESGQASQYYKVTVYTCP